MPSICFEERKIPESLRSAYGTPKKRLMFPESHFLLKKERKFPFKDLEGNISCPLLRAAISRAGQYGYKEVQKRAKKLFEENCKKKTFEREVSFKLLERKGDQFLGIVLKPGFEEGGITYSKEMILESCYRYNLEEERAFYRHQVELGKDEVQIVESYCAPVDFSLGEVQIPEGTWLQRWLISNPELQKQVAEGEISGLSLGGFLRTES